MSRKGPAGPPERMRARAGEFSRSKRTAARAGRSTRTPRRFGRKAHVSTSTKRTNAYSQSAHPQASPAEAHAEQGAGPQGLPPASRRLHARLHDDPEEAELGSAEGRQGPADH